MFLKCVLAELFICIYCHIFCIYYYVQALKYQQASGIKAKVKKIWSVEKGMSHRVAEDRAEEEQQSKILATI
jgi:hypothetical protein